MTSPNLLFKHAAQAYQQGQFKSAEQACIQILEQQPRHADALHLLGILCAQTERWQEAEEYVKKAIKANRKAAVFHNTLGNILQKQDKWEAAKASYQQALRLSPKLFDAQHNLGEMFRQLGDTQKAEQCFRKALKIQPNYPDALNGLGQLYRQAGDFDKALKHYQKLLQQHPNFAIAHHNLGLVHKELQQWEAALACFKHAFDIDSQYADAYVQASEMCVNLKQIQTAVVYLRHATRLQTEDFDLSFNLGNLCERYNYNEDAIEAYHHALRLQPESSKTWVNLGNVYQYSGRIKKALSCFERALLYAKDEVSDYFFYMLNNNKANALLAQGDIEHALPAYNKALNITPTRYAAHSNLLLAKHYSEHQSRADIFAQIQFFKQHCEIKLPDPQPFQSHQPIRLAYFSNDMRRHSVAYFMENILEHHDHKQFEIFIYMHSVVEDEVSERLKTYADHWVNCTDFNDTQVVQHIHQQGIDILIDLGGHTGNNRINILANKPAPIQISYLGYPDTTGLDAMDYRIADRYTEPKEAQQYSTETILRLPHSYFSYRPDEQAVNLEVGTLPVLDKGYITFGSFNNYSKINSFTVELWAEVLNAIPQARLFLKAKSFNDPDIRQACLERFMAQGITEERIFIKSYASSLTEHLKLYQNVDICLDAHPYHGATTTCEALWMGIPVLSLQGATHAARVGQSLLTTVGLSEWAVETSIEFVDKAQQYANNIKYLQTLRETMRERLKQSLLMQGKEFTHNFEEALLQTVKCTQAITTNKL